jgi:hypothetical protein
MTLLRLAMAAWGIFALIFGLAAMLFPGPIAALGQGATNTFLLGSWGWLTALLGLGLLLASKDPIRHILLLNLALIHFLVAGLYDLFHVFVGAIGLRAVAPDMAVYIVFGLLFLALYPRAPRMVPTYVRSPRGMLYTDADQGGLFLKQGDSYIAYFIPLSRQQAAAKEATASTPEPVAAEEGLTRPSSDETPPTRRGGALDDATGPSSEPPPAEEMQTEASEKGREERPS